MVDIGADERPAIRIIGAEIPRNSVGAKAVTQTRAGAGVSLVVGSSGPVRGLTRTNPPVGVGGGGAPAEQVKELTPLSVQAPVAEFVPLTTRLL